MRRALLRTRAAITQWMKGSARDRSRDAEFESFLAHDVDERVARGASLEDARRAALAAFGGLAQVRELTRAARAGAWFEEIVRDMRMAGRAMGRSRGLSAAVVASLSLGIAVVIVAIAFINAWLYRDLPGIRQPRDLVELGLRRMPEGRPPGWTMHAAQDYEWLSRGLVETPLIATYFNTIAAAGPIEARQINAMFVSGNYFEVLGAQPSFGRALASDDDRADRGAVAVISDAFWRRAWSADPSVVGRTIRVAGVPVVVVGVGQPEFVGATARLGGPVPDIWLPLVHVDRLLPESTAMPGRDRSLRIIGRVETAYERERLLAAAQVLMNQRIASGAFVGQRASVTLSDVALLDPSRRGETMLLVLPVPLLVLTIACLNAANLLLARGSGRRRELAIRLAIGAARLRIVRQLLIESVLLAAVASGIALLVAHLVLQALSARLTIPMPIDAVVLIWTVGVAAICTTASGLLPAFRVIANAPVRTFATTRGTGDEPSPSSRGRRALVIAQVALSIGVLATTTQLVSLLRTRGGSAGTGPERLLMASFDLDQVRFEPERASMFYERLTAAVSALPGVEHAGLARSSAVWTFGRGAGPGSLVVWKEGQDAGDGTVIIGGYAGGGLFDALGLNVVEGRPFAPTDRSGPPRVAIVNRVFANQLANGPAVGRSIRVYGYSPWDPVSDEAAFASARDVTIVGVIDAVEEPRYSQDGSPVAKVYVSAPLQPEPALTLYARTRGLADELVPAVRDVVRAIDSGVPVVEVGSLAAFNERSMGPAVGMARAAGVMGHIALALAAAGLLAIVSYVVAFRSREFAIRMTLGARPVDVLQLVLRQAMRMVIVGFVIGGGIALALTQVFRAESHGAPGLDVEAFLGSTALLVVAMLLASAVPAVRAAQLDPIANLKEG